MIYLDSSVVLAHLLGEDRRPSDALWAESLVSSRLLEFEAWNRLHRLGIGDARGPALREILERVTFVEFSSAVLGRALEPFPIAVRTLDALHLATIDYLQKRDGKLRLATHDARMAAAARAMKITLEKV